MPNKRLDKSLKKTLNKKENKLITFSGELGIPLNGSKLVEVPNRKGYVFVRISGNMSEVIQAYNSEVSAIYGLPVLLARQNNVYRIIGRNLDLYRDWNNIPYLPRHGTQHSFNHELGLGADITWVYSQQFMPLLGYPSGSAGSMNLSIVPAFYSWQGQYYYAQTTGTPDFTPYLPTITGSAVMTLLYIQPSDNSLQIIAGSPFSNSITGSAELAQYIPDIDRSVGIPIAAVRLVTGTTGLLWNNIYDVRDFFTIGNAGGGGGGMGFVAWDEGILLGTGTVLNFVGPNVDASISGSVVRVFITGSTGGSVTVPVTGTFVVQDEGVTLGSATTLNVVSPSANISISGSVARLFITGSQSAIVEDLTPQVSGTNTHFILSQSVQSGGILLLYNGIAQRYGTHFTVSGTFLDTLFTPQSGTLTAVEMGTYFNPAPQTVGQQLIAEVTPSGVSTITLATGISSSYKKLIVEYAVRSTNASVAEYILISFNNDTTDTNYREALGYTYGAGTVAGEGADARKVGIVEGANSPANAFGMGTIDIPYYNSTSFNKKAYSRGTQRQDASAVQELSFYGAIEWESTVAITRVDLSLTSGNFTAGSVIRLYGVY